MTTYMLDTNVYTFIDECTISLDQVAASCTEIVHTQVQVGELMTDIPDANLRERRLNILHTLSSRKLPAETDVWMDSLHWDDNGIWTEEPDIVADRVAKGSYRRKPRHDAMILAAAKREGCTLVTDDSDLNAKARGEGVPCMTAEELFYPS